MRGALPAVLLTVACGGGAGPHEDDFPPPVVDAAASDAAAMTVDAAPAGGSSLRFFGTGAGDVDRVKIPIDDPATSAPGPAVDVGTTDFTIEFWMCAGAAENPAPATACGAGLGWIYGNILLDRDRYSQDRKFGVSIAGGVVVFGVSGDGTGDLAMCGASPVLDHGWHHVAVDRRRSDGRMRLWVDGALDAEAMGPGGDVSYPDDGVPGDFCGGPCTGSDPFLVLGAEKHDAGAAYPSYAGWLDELRVSTTLRYDAPFARPAAAFAVDGDTAALYHFDEGQGTQAADAAGGPPGELRVGGDPAGPGWSPDTAFGGHLAPLRP